MKNVYVITEEGKVWGKEGLAYIKEELMPGWHETDTLNICQGLLYNSPQLMIDELTEHPDSYIIVSYDHIASIPPESIPAVTQVLKNHLPDEVSTWEILRHSVEENRSQQ